MSDIHKLLCPDCGGRGSTWNSGVRGSGEYWEYCYKCNGTGDIHKSATENELYYDGLQRRKNIGYCGNSPEEKTKKNKVVSDAFNVPSTDFTTPTGRIFLLTLIYESYFFDLFREVIHQRDEHDSVMVDLIIGYNGHQDGGYSFSPTQDKLLNKVYDIICNPPPWKHKGEWHKPRTCLNKKIIDYY